MILLKGKIITIKNVYKYNHNYNHE